MKFLKKFTDKKLAINLVGWMLAAACTVTAAIYVSRICSRDLSLMLVVNGEEVVCVENRQVVEGALLLLDEKLDAKGVLYSEKRDITYKYTLSNGKTAGMEECVDILYGIMAEDYVRAYSISLGGQHVAACPTYAEAEKVVAQLKDHIVESAQTPNDNGGEIELTTEFEITSVICDSASVSSASDVCSSLFGRDVLLPLPETDGVEGTRVVADGSSFLVDPNRYQSLGPIKNAATGSTNNDFSVNINITGIQSAIEYKTVVSEKYSEIIPFVTEEIESDELYVGEIKIVTAGENGIADNVYDVSYADGVEVSRTLVSSRVVAEPKTQVVLVGTKEKPSTEPTGSFMWPLQQKFTITSKWGIDRTHEGLGSYHTGLDMAGVSVGDPIYAADGGTVICAKEVGGYGLLVRIRHEDGVETYYAHMSRMYVKNGDKVYKGQKIGAIGMTGLTTGPHLHFEVRINGSTVNPEKYLPKR